MGLVVIARHIGYWRYGRLRGSRVEKIIKSFEHFGQLVSHDSFRIIRANHSGNMFFFSFLSFVMG